jgi:Zn-dependent membrane protease YugP
MLYLISIVLLIALVVGPSYWVKHIMERYSKPEDRYAGTGAELARTLLDQANLPHVKIEVTDLGDHYDPLEKVVRLTPDKYHGRSLTAITVAAHEVGHAIQDRDGYLPLIMRTRLVQLAAPVEKLGAGILMLAPIVVLATRAPIAGALFLAGGLLTLGTSILVHLLTLPMEMNASFARALPLLEQGNHLKPGDAPHARKLLKAAAWTYVSASLMTLLNIARWWAIIRR